MSPYLKAIAADRTQPIDPRAVTLWLTDLKRPSRWFIRPLITIPCVLLLHVVWFIKRLPLPQFSAHELLQKLICWFCHHFVTPEANELILRHYVTESNILNFWRDNLPDAEQRDIAPIDLYPPTIDAMKAASFVDHDQELFRLFAELSGQPLSQVPSEALNWTHWQSLDILSATDDPRPTQVVDFETAHLLFMSLFCLLLTREEYQDAINGFKLDQSIAMRIGDILGDPSLVELAYNKHPLYLIGPWNLTERFLMHGFFTEQLHARIAQHHPGEQPRSK